MPRHPENPEVELRKTVSDGRAVIVAGTGISIAASRDPISGKSHPEASWAGLLESGLEWLKEHNLISDGIAAAHLTLLKEDPDTHHFISAAQDITRLMGGVESQHFADWLTRSIGSIKAHDRKGLDALEALHAHGNVLATTNYDSLLLGDAGVLKPVTWKEPDAFLRAAQNKEADKVIFLQGFWLHSQSVVLDWTSYENITRDEQYREALASFWQMTTWVYVGCGANGLSDPDFGLLLERYGKRARQADLWDFCLVRRSQREEFQAHFDKLHINVCAVSFGESHDDLPEYLRSLLPAPVAAPTPATVPASTPAEPNPTPMPPTLHAEPVSEKQACVSYAWKEERSTDPRRGKKVEQFCERLKATGSEVIRDTTHLQFGDRLSTFMRQIGNSDRVFVFLSDAYLRSPNCMYELLVIWQSSGDNLDRFIDRIKVLVMPNTDIFSISGRMRYAAYWKQQRDELHELIDAQGLESIGPTDLTNWKHIYLIALDVNEMLAQIVDILRPGDFDEFIQNAETW